MTTKTMKKKMTKKKKSKKKKNMMYKDREQFISTLKKSGY